LDENPVRQSLWDKLKVASHVRLLLCLVLALVGVFIEGATSNLRPTPEPPLPNPVREPYVIGHWYTEHLPDGQVVTAHLAGCVWAVFPDHPQLFDMYYRWQDRHYWIYAVPLGGSVPTWIDP
jgi:hypothetical protein